MTSFDPFPWYYQAFFQLFEPACTMGGIIFAVFSPIQYAQDQIPISIILPQRIEDIHPSTIMSVRQLGSCFFLFFMFSTILLRRIHVTLQDQPILLESILTIFLLCLAIADCTHISFTFYDLGLAGTLDYKNWNTLVIGNCGITALLFIVRLCWFNKIGRGSITKMKRKKGGKGNGGKVN